MMPMNSQETVPARRAVSPIRVLLADDHAVTLWGLRQLVESAQPGMCVAGTASTCAELLSHPCLPQTDVVLLDLGLSDGNGIDCIAGLVDRADVNVILLTGDQNPAHHLQAVLRGARGVVVKSQPTEHILAAVEQVHRGEVWFDRALMTLLMTAVPGLPGAGSRAGQTDDASRRIDSLTPKERLVVQAVVRHRGAKTLVVAETLGMCENTLRNHLTAIYGKLGVQRRLDLYAYAIEHRLGTGPASDRRKPVAGHPWGQADSAWGRLA